MYELGSELSYDVINGDLIYIVSITLGIYFRLIQWSN